MDQSTALRIAARFVGLPVEQRRQILDKMIATGQSFRLLPIAATRGLVPAIALSYAQQRLFFLWQMEPDSPFYNVPMAVRLHGALDESALRGALTQLIARHESLRTRFKAVEGECFQEILPPQPAVLDMQTCVEPLDEVALRERIQAWVAQPFDLLAGPLMRVQLLRLAPDEHLLSLCMHHIICDGWSSELMVQEFMQGYAALAQGQTLPSTELAIQYADYAIWQRAWLEAGEGERQLAYWKAQLGDEQPVLSLPQDRERPATPSYRGAMLRAEVPAKLAEALRAVARKEGQTLFMVMLAAVSVVLARYSGQADIRIGAPNAGRNRRELEGLIGFFINTQVLRLQVDQTCSFAQLLQQAKAVVTGAQAHQDLPFEQLVDALVPERNLGHNPLFQFKLNQNLSPGGQARDTLGDLTVQGVALQGGVARFDLALDFTDSPQGIEAIFTYATDLFDAPRIKRLAASLLNTLQAMVDTPQARVLEVPEPAQQVVEQTADYPHQDVLSLWRQGQWQGRQTPALRCEAQTLNHAELEQHSNRLAQWLVEHGVRGGTVVGVCQARSIEWVVSLLAVLKAGGVYLPLDPQQPGERLHQLLQDSGATVLIHAPDDTRFAGLSGVKGQAFEPAQWAHCSDQAVPVDVHPAQPAYIIFTSGSTGRPKGVVISHRALAHYVQGVLKRLALAPGGSMAMVSTIAADLGHTVLFGALASGRELHLLAPDLAFDPDGFAAYMADYQVSVLKVVPSHLQGLLQAARPADVLPAHALILGGEACPCGLVEAIRALKPGCRVINHYGPTETTVGILTHEPTVLMPGERTVPVGLPLDNARAQVLDDYLNPVAQGVTGELYLGGQGVAQGYLNQPALTAERFIPDAGGARLYRSGDRAWVTCGAVIGFAGRADDQVKIRGYRVEPGEVAQWLAGLSGVHEACVQALPLDSDETRLQLVAYCVVAPGTTVPGLQQSLQAALPEHMVPAHILLLDRLPLTANGKLDKRALPQPGAVARGYVAPVGEVEIALAQVWADVLKLEQVGSSDNFFELGGDSILSLQIVARAKRKGLKLTPKQLFEKQSIGALAQVVKRIEARQPPAQAPVSGALALLPAQVRFFDTDIIDRHHWNQSLLLAPREALHAERLAQALCHVVEHHDALRLRFTQGAGTWSAAFHPVASQGLLWQRDIADLAAVQAVGEEAQSSLDLGQGPLVRGVLMNLADGQQRLLLIAHHLVVDGVSWRVVLEDLQATYRHLSEGRPPQPLATTCSLQQWAEHLHRHAASAALQSQLGGWQAMLDQPAQELPADNPRGSQDGRHARSAMTRLGAQHTQRLLKLAPATYRTQINDLLLTALATVLCEWSRQPSVLIQLEGHGREDLFDADLSRTVGWFTSLFPVRLTPSQALGDSIKAIKEQLRAVPDRGLGYGVLRYLGAPDTRAALQALPEPRVTFNYLGQFDGSFAADQGALFAPALENAGRSRSEQAPLGNWLSLNGQVYDGALQLEWTYSGDRYEAATVEQLAGALERRLIELVEHCTEGALGGITPSDVPLAGLAQAKLDNLPVPAADIEDIYPLSPMQQGMLFHSLLAQRAGDYINQMRVDAQGLDVDRFIAAWQQVIDRHEVLRASFIDVQGQYLQVIRRHVPLAVQSLDWRDRQDSQQQLLPYAQDQRQRGFDLQHDPLLRLTIIRTGDDTWHMIYTQHHILLDGWSSSRLMGEVLQAYAGDLPAAQATRYRDYIQWLQQQDKPRSEAFWRQQLAPLQAPTRLAQAMRQDKAALGHGHDDHYQVLDATHTQALAEFARQQRVTVNTLVQAAWLLLLQRYTGQGCVTFGATVSGRPADLPGVEQQLGLFINTLPVIASPRAEQAVGDWLAQVQQLNLALREHEHTPLYEIQRWAGGAAEGLFDTLLVFENYPVSEALQQGAPAGLVFSGAQNQEQTNYPLTLAVGLGASLSVHYSYDRSHFTEACVAQLAEQFGRLLMALASDARAAVGELPLLEAAAHQQIVEGWNRTDADYPAQQCLTSLIEAQVQRSPEAVALLFGEQRLSYRALNQRANRLAHHLRGLGVGPDVLVGIAAERSLEMVVGLLAILKAGGAYVPLDPEYPQERLAYMIQDSGITLLLTQAHLRLPAVDGVQCLLLEAETGPGSDDNPVNLTDPANLAYVIYTSGSTGRPKGAGNSHRALVNRLWWMQKAYGLGAEDTVLQKTPFSFDVSVWEFFWPLLTGARLALAQPGDHRDPERLVETIQACQVSTVHFVPSMLQAFLGGAAVERCQSLRRIVCSGEALPAEVARQTLARLPQAGLYNLYGPTEAAIDVTHWTCQAEAGAGVPIGTPIDNLRTHVLDGGLQPVMPGMAAELYLGGVGLARGYHGRAALTAERFVPDPFDAAGGRLYRTGDLASYRADGVIEYAGRIDHQVKIRGLRIELGEIEAQLLVHEAIREAVVIAVDGPGGKQLVAYLVADEAVQEQALRAHLKTALPDYMVPTHLMILPALPLSPNGKLDRKALPAPDASQLQGEYVAPQGELETQLAAIWAQVLKVERVGRTDNFFQLGGHSLLATQVISLIRHELNLEWPLRHLFDQPVLADFAGFTEHAQAQAPRLTTVDRTQPLLGSYAQQRQWFLWQLEPDSVAYNMATTLRLTGPLNVEALQASVQALVDRHESLRTTFSQEAEEVVQVVADHLRFPDIQPLELASPASLAAQLEACTRQPFDLRQGPLLRVVLLRLGREEHVLVLTLHHIICDGWSLPIMVDELVQGYESHVAGAALNWPALAVQYADYAAWQRQWMAAGEQARQLNYWREQLGEQHPVLELPTDRPRPALQSHAGARVAIDIDPSLALSLKHLAQQQGTTLFMLLLASFQTLLHRYSGQPDIRVGVPIANRTRVETEGLIGFFVNTQVLRAEFDLHTTFSDLLQQVRRAALGAQAHQDLPFEQLVEALHPQRSLSHSPLFQVMYNHQSQPQRGARQVSGLSVEAVVAQRHSAQFDLTLDTFEHAHGIDASMGYASALFDERTVRRLADHWRNLLEGIVAAPGQRVAQLPLLSPAQREQIVQDGNRTQAHYPREHGLHRLIEAQVARTPDAVALVHGDRTVTYQQLNQRANQLAVKLREMGVGPDTLVGIAVQRGVDMVVGLLGILKAGGAYVPLDPEYPRERLAYMMEHSGAQLLLTQSQLAAHVPAAQARTWCLDTDWPQIANYPTANLAHGATPHHLAYCIYTSGSTGKPKGVAVSHQALVNFLASMAVQPGLEASDRVLALTSLSFDIAGLELYLPLYRGASVVLLAEGQNKDPQALLGLIEQQAMTTVQATPSTWRMLMEVAGPQAFSGRKLLTGGEALAPDLAERMLAQGGVVWNLYGPTETTIWSAAHCLSQDKPQPWLGGPIANTTLYVLGSDLDAVPAGVAGELLIGGDGLARGYLHRPGLTAERFVPDPFGSGGRVYRTGDLARLRAEGVLEYAGRIDHQVKIRGLRIELGEIEARLLEHPEVREAVVVDVDSDTGKQLVAYLVVTALAADLDAHRLRTLVREHVGATLPDYMIPAQFIVLGQLPLSPNGKLDRNALPKPDVTQLQQTYQPPGSELEQRVAAIWADVLKVERVGLGDHFFELGGHSLLATQVVTRIRQQLDLEVALRELFEHPVLGDFTQGLEGRQRQTDPLHDEFAKSLEALKRLTMEEIDDLIS